MIFNFEYKRIYKDLHLVENQLLIRNENKHKSGIYLIYNKINKKYYIGSAITNRINYRFRNHCIHGTGSKLINRSINKYGLNNFYFFILEYFPGFVKKENLNKSHLALLERETFYIQKLKPLYNRLTLGTPSLGFKLSDEVTKKMRLNYSQESKDFCKNLNYGKTWVNERILLFSKISKLRNENKELRSLLSANLGFSLILYNKDLSIHSEYLSIKQMASIFNCCRKTISKAIKDQTIFKDIGLIKKKV